MLCLLRRAVVGALGLLLVTAACNRTDDSSPAQDSRKSEAASTGAESPPPPPDLADRAFPLLAWSVHMLQSEYFDSTRFEPTAQLVAALDALGMHTPEFFAERTADGTAVAVRVRAAKTTFSLDDLETLDAAARRLEEVLVYAQTHLDLDPEPLHEMEYAAINGLLSPLDPHTILLTPEEHADLGERTRGSFGGIGAEIRAERRAIVIVRVLPDMPAERAGIEPGDVIIRIGDRSTVSMGVSEAQGLLRGPVGTTVGVKVRRKNESLDIDIERAVIRLDSVRAIPLPGNVEYVRVTHFQEDTAAKLAEAIEAAKKEDRLGGLVLDLRGNGGGLLVQATAIVDLFVRKGALVIVRSAYGREVDEAEEATTVPADVPVVVLVDEEAASAAEIVSGGLQALGRATVIGRSTFGKGSVQVVRPATPYGRELALKLTIAEYLVAGDQRIQARGVVPDLELLPVEPTGLDHVVRYYDLERFERARERARMANHPSAKHELIAEGSSESPLKLRYLATTAVPEELSTVKDLPEVILDPEVRIASTLAQTLPGAVDAEARAAAVAKALAGLQGAEDTRIDAALAEADVTWGDEGEHDVPLEVRATIKTPLPILAGEAFTLEVAVTNPSTQTVQRVHAITDCERERLDGIEVLFGDIAPGKTVTRTVELHVMPWYSDFVGDLDLEVHSGEPDAKPDARARAVFETRALPQPSLSYDVWIVDDPALVDVAPQRPESEPVPGLPSFSVQGNGDGMLQPGERVLLAFRAYNDGDGDSPDLRAFLRNLSGEQGLLEEGFVALGPVKAGASATGAFGIWVNEKADPTRPLLLDLTVGDAQLRVAASDELSLRVLADAPALEEGPGVFTVEGDTVQLRAGAGPSAAVVATAPAGASLAVRGTAGKWRWLTDPADESRRWFVPADLKSLVPSTGAAKTTGVVARRSVQPPTLTFESVPSQTNAERITLRGVASHPERVRDVVVMVRPPGSAQADKKVDYFAAAKDTTALSFEASLPLQPGVNRIFVLARSGEVQAPREMWVYRASDSAGGP
ncbi:MAG: MXAN_5808 family serine peptidase [Myxococcota bacterium]